MGYLQIGDFDNDSTPDYLYLSNSIWYLRLGKNPRVAINTGLRTQNGDQPEYSMTADMNADGCTDLITLNNSRGWYVWYSNCDGTLRAGQQGNRPAYNSQDKHPLLVDLNGDGYPELVFKYSLGRSGNVVLAYYLNGPAGLSPNPTLTGLTVSNGQKLIPINFFGNGKPDIYVTRADDCNDANRNSSVIGVQNGISGSSNTSSCAQTEGVLTWNGSTLVHVNTPATDMVYAKDPLFLDLNGDGLTDMLSPQCFPRCQWQAYINRGGSWFSQTVSLAPSNGPVSEEATRHAYAVDYNGDGLSDLMYPDTNGRWSVLLSNGKSLGPRQDSGLPTAGYPNTLFVDYHGNGWADMLYLDGRWQVRARGIGIMPDLMQRVSRGSGRDALVQHTISYLPLSDLTWRSVLYSGHNGTVKPPLTRHFLGPLYVVRSFAAHAGYNTGGSPVYVNSYYRYAGAKLDLQGRGFMGFSLVEAANTNTSIVTRTRYRQDFPYAGMVLQALQYVSNFSPTGTTSTETQGPKICRLPNGEQDFCPEPPPQAANSILDNPPGRLVTQTDNEAAADVTPLDTGGESRFPYVRSSKLRNYDLLSGALYRSTVTSYAYDTHGNPTQVTARTTGGAGAEAFEIAIMNTYAHDNAPNWCLGLPSSTLTMRTFNGTSHTSQHSAEHDPGKCTVVAETSEPGNATLELVRRYGYDEFGNRVSSTVSGANIAARTSRTQFDNRGLFAVQLTDPLGHAQTQAWNPAFGAKLSHTDANGVSTRWAYDAFGRRTQESGPYPGQQVTWERSWCNASCRRADAAYRIVMRSADGARTVVEYDALERAVLSARSGPAINGTANLIDEETYYDPLGRPYLVSRPYYDGSAVRCWDYRQYDNLNRLVTEWQPANETECTAGIPELSVPPAYSRVSRHTHSGLQTTSTDALGRNTIRSDNLLGQPASVTDADHHATYYDYDPLGNPVKTTDANGNVARMAYDQAGRKTEMWDPDMGHWTYAYDALGQLIRQTDAKGQQLTQGYDLLGRLVQRSESEGVTRWAYDVAAGAGLGRLAYVARTDGYWEGYAYDDYGALTDKVTIINDREYWITTPYDDLGRVDLVAYPDISVADASNAPTGAPPALRVPASSSGKFDVAWDVSADGAAYHLYRAPDQGVTRAPPTNAREVYSGTRSPHHENLSAPGSYRYWLNLCRGQKCSTTYSTAAVAVGRPAAPGNFQVHADRDGSDGRYTASWNAVESAENYKLFHSANAETPGTEIYKGTALSQPLALDDGNHYYQLQACALTGCSPFVGLDAGIRVLRTPGAPTLSAPASSADGRYTVSWSAPADATHVKHYQLEEATNSSFAAATTMTENASATSRAFSHPVNSNTAYYYRIQACNQDGAGSSCGPHSNTGTVKVVPPPGAPVNFSIPGTSSTGNFRISWEAGAGGAPETYTVSDVIDVCEYDYETRRDICSRLPGGNSKVVFASYVDISGLKNGTYKYVVQACNASGCSTTAYAGAIVVALLASAPAGLSASVSTSSDGNYLLSWGEASGSPTSYQLFEASAADFSNQAQIYTGTGLSWNATGKTPNGAYYYRVRACNSVGCSAYTNPVAVQVAVLPGTPYSLSASPATSTDGNYRLSWGIASGSPASYQLVEATAADFSNQTQLYDGGGTSWPINGKTPNTNYYYRVRACNSIGCGSYTNAVSVKVAVPPAVPVNVSMPASSYTGSFRITWNAGTGNPPTSYAVAGTTNECEYDYETRQNICWRLPGGGNYMVPTSYVDINGLQEGTYSYSVRACDGGLCSSAASAGSIKVTLPPGVPASISRSTGSTTTGNYSVSWGVAPGSPTSYQLFESTSANSAGETQVYTGSARSWGMNAKSPNGTYYYRARACGTGGCGPHTDVVSVQVAKPPPKGGCRPNLPACGRAPEDGLVAVPTQQPEPAPFAAGAASRVTPVGATEHTAEENRHHITALARTRQRYANVTSSALPSPAADGYTVAPAAYQAGIAARPPLRQDPRIQNQFLERGGSVVPHLVTIASSKPTATYTHVVKYSYDETGHLSQIHEIRPDGAVGVRYWAVADSDAAGHITGEVLGNGLSRARGYDDATGLQSGVNSGIRDTTLQDEAYEWDRAGNLLARRDAVTDLAETFGYDQMDRLTHAPPRPASTSRRVRPTMPSVTSRTAVPGAATPTAELRTRTHNRMQCAPSRRPTARSRAMGTTPMAT